MGTLPAKEKRWGGESLSHSKNMRTPLPELKRRSGRKKSSAPYEMDQAHPSSEKWEGLTFRCPAVRSRVGKKNGAMNFWGGKRG